MQAQGAKKVQKAQLVRPYCKKVPRDLKAFQESVESAACKVLRAQSGLLAQLAQKGTLDETEWLACQEDRETLVRKVLEASRASLAETDTMGSTANKEK